MDKVYRAIGHLLAAMIIALFGIMLAGLIANAVRMLLGGW